MKQFNFNVVAIMLLILFSGLNQTSFSQTQEEIEQMLQQGGKDAETEKEDKKTKADKKAENEQAKLEAEAKKAAEKEEAKVESASKKSEEKIDAAVENTKDEVIQTTESMPKDAPEEKKGVVRNVKTASDETPKEKENSNPSTQQRQRTSSFQKPLKTWSIGVGGNLVHPLTDIRYMDFFGAIDPINENQWGGQLRVTKMFDGAFGLMFNAQYNRVQGAFDSLVVNRSERDYLEQAGIDRGVYFRNNVIQGSINVYWNISNTLFNMNKRNKSVNTGKPIKERKFSLYTYTGVGMSVFDPHVMYIDNNAPATFDGIELQTDRTSSVFIPFAIGTKFKLSKVVDFNVEYGVTFMLNDRLDGLEFNHPSRRKNDAFSAISMGFDFKLGGKKTDKEHIQWKNPIEPVYEELAKLDKMERTLKKLTTDSDEDGVSDYFDKDNETPKGVAVDGSGKPIDVDGDGVPDYMDLDPFTDPGASVDEFGKALDSDGDGVPDHRDLEPNTPEGTLVNFQGVSIEASSGDTRGLFFPPIYFDTDKSNIKRAYEADLFLIARNMLRMEDVNFILEGHCDERGSDEYNKELGERRAQAVKKHLVENYKIDANRIEVVSKGNSQLDSPRFHINRRVDVLLKD